MHKLCSLEYVCHCTRHRSTLAIQSWDLNLDIFFRMPSHLLTRPGIMYFYKSARYHVNSFVYWCVTISVKYIMYSMLCVLASHRTVRVQTLLTLYVCHTICHHTDIQHTGWDKLSNATLAMSWITPWKLNLFWQFSVYNLLDETWH